MGYGSYQASDWTKLKASRGISATTSYTQIFKNQKMDDRYNPKFFDKRESCDSNDSPQSTPIIIAFDDTGSMGYLAEEIAKNSLNKTITYIYEKEPVTNPHVLCAAFGNHTDAAPLQVTQFEADIRIAEQLFDIWIERGGYGYSADTFVWYFAAKHTKIDSFEKRNKKGFLFTIGDDVCDRCLSGETIERIFGEKDVNAIEKEDVLKMAMEKYEVFHIVTKPVSHHTVEQWCGLLPGRVAVINKVEYLSELITSIMQLSNGMSRDRVLAQWDKNVANIINDAIQNIRVNNKCEGDTSIFDSVKDYFKK